MKNQAPVKPRITRKSVKKQPSKDRETAGKTIGLKIPGILEAMVRWGLVVVVFILVMGGLAVKNAKVSEAGELSGELAAMQSERDDLKEELDLLNDPAWREAYWKWQTMSHKPGEYYIEFIEPGSL